MSATDVVDAFIAAIEAKDIDAAVALVSDDCEYDNVPMGKVFGPAGIKELLEPFTASCTAIEWVVHRQVGAERTVFNERLDRFQMPTGWIELPVAGVFEVSDGKISLWRDYFDLATFQDQMAAPPT
ncbi:MAG: nuclear transport factor 2 family protein [Acidimicrobiia bacterium]|nr:nuclear transport factor 2 family protein [Acidimicrobiia bacterium]